MSVLMLLEKAKAKISDEIHFCQKAFARDSNGAIISSHHPDAVCWCLFGGLMAVAAKNELQSFYKSAVHLLENSNSLSGDLIDLNDNIGHAAVIACLDGAICSAKQKAMEEHECTH